MGKPTGFLEYSRKTGKTVDPKARIKNYNEFHLPLSEKEQKCQSARCMDCGVPFCQSGVILKGMVSGCPLNNLIPEWNELVYTGTWQQAYNRLKKTNSFPEFTARVCPAPCEAACTCGLNGDPVSIKENEYAIIERA
jgi:glutamate synthase (NADPH/NADH) small chain